VSKNVWHHNKTAVYVLLDIASNAQYMVDHKKLAIFTFAITLINFVFSNYFNVAFIAAYHTKKLYLFIQGSTVEEAGINLPPHLKSVAALPCETLL